MPTHMVMLVASWMVQLLTVAVMFQSTSAQTTCTAVSTPSQITVTCHFASGTAQSVEGFNIQYFRPNSMDQDAMPLACNKLQTGGLICQKGSGVVFNEQQALRDNMTLTMPRAQGEAGGRYLCQPVPSHGAPVHHCTLTYTEITTVQPATPNLCSPCIGGWQKGHTYAVYIIPSIFLLVLATVLVLLYKKRESLRGWLVRPADLALEEVGLRHESDPEYTDMDHPSATTGRTSLIPSALPQHTADVADRPATDRAANERAGATDRAANEGAGATPDQALLTAPQPPQEEEGLWKTLKKSIRIGGDNSTKGEVISLPPHTAEQGKRRVERRQQGTFPDTEETSPGSSGTAGHGHTTGDSQYPVQTFDHGPRRHAGAVKDEQDRSGVPPAARDHGPKLKPVSSDSKASTSGAAFMKVKWGLTVQEGTAEEFVNIPTPEPAEYSLSGTAGTEGQADAPGTTRPHGARPESDKERKAREKAEKKKVEDQRKKAEQERKQREKEDEKVEERWRKSEKENKKQKK
ncbi:hypothetical protein ACOMHN_061116 [Nucella lapillus]